MQYHIVKQHKRLYIADANNAQVYTPPDFITLQCRSQLQALADAFTLAGCRDINQIILFEKDPKSFKYQLT